MIKSELKLSYLLFFALIGFLGWDDVSEYFFGHEPYKNVEIILAEVRDGKFNIIADFETTDCKYQQVEFVGVGLTGADILKWQDNDGLGPNHVRSQGTHTMRVTADLDGKYYEQIEVRTRHRCDFGLDENGDAVGGEMVNRIFMTYRPPAVGP